MSGTILNIFPRTEQEFRDRFGDEEACRLFLIQLRWPSGFVCPHCGHREAWRRTNRDEWICAGRTCGKETSLRAGTVFHNSPKPLRDWFLAMFHVISSKQGISALELQRRLGYGSYRTTLRWLRELRRAIGNLLASRPQMSGEVEVDEMLLGGFAEGTGLHGFSDPSKACIVGAAERRGGGCGRTRMKVIPKNDGKSIRAFVYSTVQLGSMVCSDGARVYRKLPGFLSNPATISNARGGQLRGRGSKKIVETHLARIHRVFSLVKRVVIGAHQGAFTQKHLQGYLDEYCFRFDGRGKKQSLPLRMVVELASSAVAVKAVPYWKSSGRVDPRIPTATRTTVWKDLAKVLNR